MLSVNKSVCKCVLYFVSAGALETVYVIGLCDFFVVLLDLYVNNVIICIGV